ncbi:hypothetical protein MTR67_009881 [Solanum verrucosum]|uniref:Uncharacterized protein n=1 Tax=Solanum verrucosum TaxID=315347 RepID=A0AAF0Q9M7_SOLVR|nr:hypothetical protein MTR67_009881 [Solanum verrucosum]
MYLVNYLEGKK